MKKIKVVHIITKLELGGAQENTLYTVSNLDKNKFEVYLLCGVGGILDNKAIELSTKNNFKLYFIKNLVREINPWKDFLALKELITKLDKIRPDIIHTHSSKAGILGRVAGYFLNLSEDDNIKNRTKIIHTFHGFGFNEFQGDLIKNFYILLEQFVARFTDKLIFVSRSNIETASKYKIGNYKDYVLIRSGIKISKYKKSSEDKNLRDKILKKLNLPFDCKVITTIGAFKPQKNLIDYIKFANIIMNSNELYNETKKKLYFLIAGDGEQRKLLESLVTEYNLSDKIKFLSWYQNIDELLSITDIFVMTSLWEGLPRSAVEALVSGVVVVAYNTDGLSDIIMSDYNGYLVNIKDVDTLSLHVIELLNNKSKFQRLKNNAKESIDKTFDIDYMVKQQDDLYCSIINLKL